MKVVYYKRDTEDPFHPRKGYYAHCLYMPHENVVLYIEQRGIPGRKYYSLTDKSEILEQARSIAEGKIPNVEGVTFSNIKEFEYDSSKLRELIQKARLKSELQAEVESGIENILKQMIPE